MRLDELSADKYHSSVCHRKGESFLLQSPNGTPLSGEKLSFTIFVFNLLGEVLLTVGLAYYLHNSSVSSEYQG